jgi:outer membrane protein TolC
MRKIAVLITFFSLSVLPSFGGGPLSLETCREAARRAGRLEELYALNEFDQEAGAAMEDSPYRFSLQAFGMVDYLSETPNPASMTDFPFVLHAIPRLQYNSGFLLSQPIYSGGQRKLKAERSDVEHALERLEIDRQGIELDGAVDELYLGILLSRKRDEILSRQLSAVRIKLSDAREAYEAGVTYKDALLSLEAQTTSLEAELAGSAAQTEAAIAMLSALTGLPVDESTELEMPLGEDLGTAVSDPALLRLDLEERRIELDKQLARASALPSLKAVGLLGYGRPSLNFFNRMPDVYWGVGLTLMIPITDWRDVNLGRDRLDAAARRLQVQRENVERQKQVALLKYDGEIARYARLLDANARTVAKYEELCDELDKLSAQGAAPVSDYLTALEQLSAARLDGELYSILKLQQQLLRKRYISQL